MFVWLCAFLINKSLYRQIKCYFPKLTLDRQDNFFRFNTNVSPYINAFDSRTVQQYRSFYSLNSRTASLISALSEIRCKWFNWHWHLDVMVISNFKCNLLSIMGRFRSPELFSVVTTFWLKSTQGREKKQCIWIKSYLGGGGGGGRGFFFGGLFLLFLAKGRKKKKKFFFFYLLGGGGGGGVLVFFFHFVFLPFRTQESNSREFEEKDWENHQGNFEPPKLVIIHPIAHVVKYLKDCRHVNFHHTIKINQSIFFSLYGRYCYF